MTDQETEVARAFARALFADAQSDDETADRQDPTPPKPPGYVVREGHVTGPAADDRMSDLARALFNPNND